MIRKILTDIYIYTITKKTEKGGYLLTKIISLLDWRLLVSNNLQVGGAL